MAMVGEGSSCMQARQLMMVYMGGYVQAWLALGFWWLVKGWVRVD